MVVVIWEGGRELVGKEKRPHLSHILWDDDDDDWSGEQGRAV